MDDVSNPSFMLKMFNKAFNNIENVFHEKMQRSNRVGNQRNTGCVRVRFLSVFHKVKIKNKIIIKIIIDMM